MSDLIKKESGASLAACSESELIRLERDNFEVKDFSILCDSFHVWLGEQKMGESPKQRIEIPRAVFNKLIAHYQRKQKYIRE